MSEPNEYIDITDIPLAQGEAKLATAEDIAKDEEGITYPNLHRRIDQDMPYIDGGTSHYAVSVSAVNSFRTTTRNIHNEASTTEEIP